ncbi:MAG: GMC family oxidoreductase [Chloroflexota bacterium]
MITQQDPIDVVVIGAGMGGAAFCYRLSAQAPHLRIVCLERGDWVQPSQMPATRPDFQRLALSTWSTSPTVRQSAAEPTPSADYPFDDSESEIKPLMWNGVGGSTIAWAAHFPRLHPSDFRTYSLDGVGDDWPFSYFDLEPYYDLNDEMMGVSGLAGDPAYPPKRTPRMPPVPLGRMGKRAALGFNELGWHWWPVDAAINTVPRNGRAACNNCGPCQQGCVSHAKASVDQTYWPSALRQGVELRTHAVVQEVVVQAGRATGVRYRDGNGQEHFQPSAYVVMACNGIGTARLLLASGIGGDQVGRSLMFHPVAYLRAVFKEELDGPAGPIGNCIYSHEFYETDLRRDFVRGFQLQITRENPLLTQSTYTNPRWGRGAQEQLRDLFRHSFHAMVMCEDLPEAHNRVALTDQIEADGLPGVKVSYTLSDNSRKMLDYGLERAEKMLQAAGVAHVIPVPHAPLTGWHLLGTARMGNDPKTSVTDASGRCHTTPNVIVADGSLFPTVGAVNPGSTIGALALKIADDLANEVRS